MSSLLCSGECHAALCQRCHDPLVTLLDDHVVQLGSFHAEFVAHIRMIRLRLSELLVELLDLLRCPGFQLAKLYIQSIGLLLLLSLWLAELFIQSVNIFLPLSFQLAEFFVRLPEGSRSILLLFATF